MNFFFQTAPSTVIESFNGNRITNKNLRIPRRLLPSKGIGFGESNPFSRLTERLGCGLLHGRPTAAAGILQRDDGITL